MKTHPGETALRAFALERAEGSREVRAHLAGCAACRSEVQLLRGLRGALQSSGRGPCPEPEKLVGWARGAALSSGQRGRIDAHLTRCLDCAAEVEGLQRLVSEGGPPGPPTRPASHRARVGARVADAARWLQDLVRFEMPPTLALVTRGGSAPGAEELGRGMEHYRAGRYERAVEELERSRAAGDRSAEAAFFAGVCRLQGGEPEAALRLLDDAVRGGARIGAYRWYRAQAHLAAGHAVDAERDLARAAALPGAHRERAKEILSELRRLAAEKHGDPPTFVPRKRGRKPRPAPDARGRKPRG